MKTINATELRKQQSLLTPNNTDLKITGIVNNDDILFIKQIYANTVDFSDITDFSSEIDSKSLKGIKRIILPKMATAIRDFALSFSPALEYIYIAKNISSIGEQLFCYCNNLTTIEVDKDNQYFSSQDGVLFDKAKKTLIRCPEGIINNYTVPDGVEKIADYAFYGCNGLKHISFPNTVKSIGKCAFQQCEGLEHIEIPESVEIINESTFFGCKNLKDITTPKKLSEIDNEAFYGCVMLKEINLPNTVKKISNAFERCFNLSSINIEDGGCTLYSIDGVVYNKENNKVILSPNLKLKHAIINGTESIGECAFESTSIECIEIAESVTSIEARAFRGCYNLKEIRLPKNLKHIDDRAFDSCTNLTAIYSSAITPPMTDVFSFCFLPFDDATLYVPKDAVEKYKSAANWNNFKTIIPL